jgi:hypothetical protein
VQLTGAIDTFDAKVFCCVVIDIVLGDGYSSSFAVDEASSFTVVIVVVEPFYFYFFLALLLI